MPEEERGAARARLTGFAARLYAEWRRLGLPARGDNARLIIAVSGGGDSTALLLAVEELRRAGGTGARVTVAHLDHLLPGDEGFAPFVADLAARCGFEFALGREDVRGRAAATGDNLEQAARKARYEFLGGEARRRGARFVLVAHTLDDQAETVLLRLLRGSGADGLGGMRALRPLVEAADATARTDGTGEAEVADGAQPVFVARPLLAWARRADTEGYCRIRGQEFVHDWINDDVRFSRVRVRNELLPLLRTLNPRIDETLARTAGLLRDDAAALDALADELLSRATVEIRASGAGGAGAPAAELAADVLAAAPAALQRRALRRWLLGVRGGLRRIEEVHVEALRSLLAGERGGRVIELPGGGRIERRRGRLRLLA